MTGVAHSLERGVARALAMERAARVSDVRYDLAFVVPFDRTAPLTGRATIVFSLTSPSTPLVLDFNAADGHLQSTFVNGRPSEALQSEGHIVIPAGELVAGVNRVQLEFQPGNAPLNRREDLFYTLFVPARAHECFPCFDQPDLKGRFTLDLTIPSAWEPIANGAEMGREPGPDGSLRVRFSETAPIPTYLFAFAAGRFHVESAQRRGRTYRVLHTEHDSAKASRNLTAVYDLHSSAVTWLEEYTGLAYPFGKFDFILIPSFQFSGMEHPGAIYYNASSLLLETTATEHQRLSRAHLIAHETAHIWFGDLVTMKWFDDVWLKEVFANLMAAKIVNPSFSDVDHELRFLLSHYPAAYGVDRTAGTHPVRQELDNLKDAGSLYGPIIYQKAPIAMRQLEQVMKPSAFRDGVRAYLSDFAFGNASWPDLLRVLNERTDHDLEAWSALWIDNAAGMALTPNIVVDLHSGTCRLVPRTNPLPYGAAHVSAEMRTFLLERLASLNDPAARGVAWITLWEETLDGRLAPLDFLAAVARAVPAEAVEQNVQLVCGYLVECYWRFFPPERRAHVAAKLESMLLAKLMASPMAATVFAAFRAMATTEDGVGLLAKLWRRETSLAGLTLGEPDEIAIAIELALRGTPDAADVLSSQLERITDADRRARFEFVMTAASTDNASREAFFEGLSDHARRRPEPWVAEGLRYLNHPCRAEEARPLLRPSLELLEEVKRTGDIFFPKQWMDAVLSGHNTREAADIVRTFLEDNPHYPERLRRVILQAADPLFRAAKLA